MNVVLRSTGDLGNMLFEWAYVKSLLEGQKEFNIYWDPVYVNSCELERIGLPITRMPRILGMWTPISHKSGTLKRLGYPLLRRVGLTYSIYSDVVENHQIKSAVSGSMFVHGRFQDCRLATDSVREELSAAIKRQCGSFIPDVEHTVGVHIRRGDYTEQYWKERLGLLSEEYFDGALRSLSLNGERVKIYTDSPEDPMVVAIAQKWEAEISSNLGRYEDLFEMSCCSKLIISNSTFSLWAALLGMETIETVVVPSPWIISDEKVSLMFPGHWETHNSLWS